MFIAWCSIAKLFMHLKEDQRQILFCLLNYFWKDAICTMKTKVKHIVYVYIVEKGFVLQQQELKLTKASSL